MSEPNDDPADTPHLHQVLYTNDVIRVLSTFVSGLLTVAEPARVRAALQHVLDNWQSHLDMFEHMKRVGQQLEERRQSEKKGKN